jgi:large subunit ribosomal protein L6
MSHIGVQPIIIPSNINLKILENKNSIYFIFKGPWGEIAISLPKEQFNYEIIEEKLYLKLNNKALWGTITQKFNQAVKGVSEGHHLTLNLNGVGYKATIQNNKLNINVGFSHPTIIDIPTYIKPDKEPQPQKLKFSSHSLELLSQWLHKIRLLRPANKDIYKHKGISISS